MATFGNSLTATEVAQILNIGRNAVYDLAKSGELHSYKMGRKLLFTLDDVNAYFARISGKAVSAPAFPENQSDISSALAPLQDFGDCVVVAGEGPAFGTLVGLLQEKGLGAAPARMCDYAALASLYSGKADAAVTCLYDQKTNNCNIPYVQRLVPGTSLLGIRISSQEIGLIVAQGNPKKLSTWGSIFRHGTMLVNRPRGTKERVILDEKARLFELVTANIPGYDNEVASDYDAAALVAGGLVDVSIGTAQTAKLVKGVQFIPLQTVNTDLFILKNERTRTFARNAKKAIASTEFRALFEKALPFDTSNMGSVIYEV